MKCTRRLLLAIPLWIAFTACSRDAGNSPQDVLEEYYTSETPIGADVIGHRPLLQQDDRAVFVTTVEQNDSIAEWYTFLVKDKKAWKIEAAKTLKFPDAYYEHIDSIQQKAGGDSVISPERLNLELTIATDSTIKAYLVEHALVLDSIVQLFAKRAVMSAVDVSTSSNPEIRDGKVLTTNRNERIQDLLERAGVTRVFRDARYPLCTFVRINGASRTEVGYVYADDGCVPPQLDPNNFIYVEKAADHWYVYKVI